MWRLEWHTLCATAAREATLGEIAVNRDQLTKAAEHYAAAARCSAAACDLTPECYTHTRTALAADAQGFLDVVEALVFTIENEKVGFC